jgi:hypothetical protein
VVYTIKRRVPRGVIPTVFENYEVEVCYMGTIAPLGGV